MVNSKTKLETKGILIDLSWEECALLRRALSGMMSNPPRDFSWEDSGTASRLDAKLFQESYDQEVSTHEN